MSEAFQIEVAAAGDRAAVVRVRGRLDAKTSPQLVQRCNEARKPAGHLVVNLAGVTFLSSSGVGAILALAEKVSEDGGNLRLGPVSLAAKTVLELLNLDHFLALHGSEEDAIAALEAA